MSRTKQIFGHILYELKKVWLVVGVVGSISCGRLVAEPILNASCLYHSSLLEDFIGCYDYQSLKKLVFDSLGAQ